MIKKLRIDNLYSRLLSWCYMRMKNFPSDQSFQFEGPNRLSYSIKHDPDESTSILVRADSDKNVYLTVHHDKNNSVGIRIDGIDEYNYFIKSQFEWDIDANKLIDFIVENGSMTISML